MYILLNCCYKFSLQGEPAVDCYLSRVVLTWSGSEKPWCCGNVGNTVKRFSSSHRDTKLKRYGISPHFRCAVISCRLAHFFHSGSPCDSPDSSHSFADCLLIVIMQVCILVMRRRNLKIDETPKVFFSIVSSLNVCEQDISKCCERIWTEFGEEVCCGTRTNCFDFGEDPNPGLNTRII